MCHNVKPNANTSKDQVDLWGEPEQLCLIIVRCFMYQGQGSLIQRYIQGGGGN